MAMKIVFLLFVLSSYSNGFSQNVVLPNESAQEWLDSFWVNVDRVVGKKMNQFSATSNNGIFYNNDSLKGKVTLINFWFTSCPGCVGEVKLLNRLYDSLKQDARFRLLAFTFDSPEVVTDTKDKYQLNYELISVTEGECRFLNFNFGYPTNLVVDTSGTITCIQTGGPPDPSNPRRARGFEDVIIPALGKLLK